MTEKQKKGKIKKGKTPVRVAPCAVIEQIKIFGPYISKIADAIGCGNTVIYRMIDSSTGNKTVAAAWIEAKNRRIDEVEDALFIAATTPFDTDDPKINVTAAIFILKAEKIAKERGWGERQEHTGADGKELIDIGTFLNTVATKKDK